MESVAKGVIVFMFAAIVVITSYFMISYGIGGETDYYTAILTGAVFILVILGVVGISYFVNRGNA